MPEHTAENDAPCEPFITQDGYDSGQAFECPVHRVREPVMVNGRQTYEVTLAMFQRLVAEHHAHVISSGEGDTNA